MVAYCLAISERDHEIEARPVKFVRVSLIHIVHRHDVGDAVPTAFQIFIFEHVRPITPIDERDHVLRGRNDPMPCLLIMLALIIQPLHSVLDAYES